jgi:uncharacterized protein YfaQ (DUF2300 family)
MTHRFTLQTVFGSGALAAAGFLALSFSSTAPAAAATALTCHGNSAQAVMECCADGNGYGAPKGMIRTGRNCDAKHVTVVCANTYAAANFKCYLGVLAVEAGGHKTPGTPPSTQHKAAGKP